MLMKHAASLHNSPKGYGSIELGMKVIAYRSSRIRFYQTSAKMSWEDAAIAAHKDVINKYGDVS
jgi:hypothetical protein